MYRVVQKIRGSGNVHLQLGFGFLSLAPGGVSNTLYLRASLESRTLQVVSYGVSCMEKREKLLDRMRNNPRDWRIEDLKTLADHYGITDDQSGSHVTFRSKDGRRATVPAHKPIKPVYISQFLSLIEGE